MTLNRGDMSKYKFIFTLLITVLMVSAAYGQGNPKKNQTKIISGTVADMDSVGNTISILTDDQHRMSFFVPGNASITRDTHDIGLMDIKQGHPVTIQYDILSSGKDIVDSIVDNNPVAQE
jgi:hypothetical protein